MTDEDLEVYAAVRKIIGMRNGNRRTSSAMAALDVVMRSVDGAELVRLMQKWLAVAPHEK